MTMIVAIKPFEIHDGDGIRTTVFLKGCPLQCEWCHNPEALSEDAQLSFDFEKCRNCGFCTAVCKCHTIQDGIHKYNREECKACGKCLKVCPAHALRIYGKEYDFEELVALLLEDREIYKASGGGVTLSGGEPLMQADFSQKLLKRLKEEGINTAVDTSAYAEKEDIDKVLEYTDTFLCDIKAYDEKLHERCTGKSNKKILENIKYIDLKNKKIEVRIPFIPGINDRQIEKIGSFIKELKNVTRVVVLPYHGLAKRKYECLGYTYSFENVQAPQKEEIDKAIDVLKGIGLNAMRNED